MKKIINSLDNDRYYANASVYNETKEDDGMITRKKNMYCTAHKGKAVVDGNMYDVYFREHHEPKYEPSKSKSKDINAFNAEDYYGPQRWNHEGKKLELTDSGEYVDDIGNSYIDEILAEERKIDIEKFAEYIAFCSDMSNKPELPKTVIHKMESWFATDAGQEFLNVFHEDAEDDLKEETVYSQSCMTHESYIDEMTGKNDDDEYTVWDVAQKKDGGISKEEFNFLGSGIPSNRNCTLAWAIVHNPDWGRKELEKYKNATWMTEDILGWCLDMLDTKSITEIVNKERRMGKHVHIDFFPATEQMKEGFILSWITIDMVVVKTKCVPYLSNELGYIQLTHLVLACEAKGFRVHITYMDPKKDSYRLARTLWNNPEEYIAKY